MEWLNNIMENYLNWLLSLGLKSNYAYLIQEASLFVISILVFILIDRIVVHYIKEYIKKISKKSKTQVDDILLANKVFDYFLSSITFYILYIISDFIFLQSGGFDGIISLIILLYIDYLLVRGIVAIFKSVNDIYDYRQTGRKRSIKSYIQVFQLIAIVIGGLIAVSLLLSKDISVLLTGIGAFAAVLMLVFKDSILGFVGGIQINANDMVRLGDWVSVPSAGADGTVIDISLTTVKIQNWNKTISTVPTYSLVTGSFQNWRGMEESGGRRIKRSLNIDIQSVRFSTEEDVEKYKKFRLLKDYLSKKDEELKEYNNKLGIEEDTFNGRYQTNIGIFRAYVAAYLHDKEEIHPNMTFLIRQLQATEKGLPMEIYVFSKVQEWAEYEDIQSDIFDHLFAIIPIFDLKVFQNPSGADFRSIIKN
ncbi:MAG: mechanosensitive ion channel family protein [Bacteroidetes bacterium]|nr:MAG: mechanosensitive ion channel family protein [Bacteroidota bacterium]